MCVCVSSQSHSLLKEYERPYSFFVCVSSNSPAPHPALTLPLFPLTLTTSTEHPRARHRRRRGNFRGRHRRGDYRSVAAVRWQRPASDDTTSLPLPLPLLLLLFLLLLLLRDTGIPTPVLNHRGDLWICRLSFSPFSSSSLWLPRGLNG